MRIYIYCFEWFDYIVNYSRYEKVEKKVQFYKKSFWWHVFRTKDDQRGLNKQMVMLINKKINDKINLKLKTFQIINYEVKQSKMMFLFIFVLFQTIFVINFIEFYFLNISWWIPFVNFCMLLFMHCDYHAYFNWFILLCWFVDQKMWSNCLFRCFWVFFLFVFLLFQGFLFDG